MTDLTKITKRLGQEYAVWKQSEKEKNKARDEFFAAVTEELESQVPAQSIQDIQARSEEQALRICQRQFVRHKVISIRQEGSVFRVVLEEDPSLRPFTYINPETEVVFNRIVSEGSPVLDDEGLREENPELWESVTVEVTKRELKPLDELTPDQAEAIRRYIALPKPQVKLGAPRKAKPEELE